MRKLENWQLPAPRVDIILAQVPGMSGTSLRLPEAPVQFAARALSKVLGVPVTECRADAVSTRVFYPAIWMEWELGHGCASSMKDCLSVLVRRWGASQ